MNLDTINRNRAKENRVRVPKICRICGTNFLGRKRQIYCSTKCRREAEKIQQYEKKHYIPTSGANDEIIRIAREAAEAGLSYGLYVKKERL